MDHERVNISTLDRSCAVMQLSRLDSDALSVLYAIATRLYHPSRGDPCAYFIFSDITGEEGAPSVSLVKEIGIRDLGTVVKTKPTENPKTGNFVIVYVWSIDHAIFKAWYARERYKKIGKVGT